MENYCRTDLARELIADERHLPEGVELSEEISLHGFAVERVKVDGEASRKIGKPAGEYITYGIGDVISLSDGELDDLSSDLAGELIYLSEKMTGKRADPDFSVLVAGLGNREMTPDAIGPLTVDGVNATSHLVVENEMLFAELGCTRLSAIAPGVLGQTGIETSKLIAAVTGIRKPDLVIVIDALAARSVDRLMSTVQFSDTGISPGSGVGNRREAIDRESVGVPVMSIGVPTVVDSSTLVYDALISAGLVDIPDELGLVLSRGKSYFVTSKDCDKTIATVGAILSAAIEKSFGIRRDERA